MKRALPWIALVLASACNGRTLPPLGQIRLGIDTDALLPPAPGAKGTGAPGLFDRLRVEIFPPGASDPCSDCTRDFGIDHETVFAGRASFGVTAKPGVSGYRARVRLFRAEGQDVVEPRRTSTLETVALLPIVPAEGIVDVHVVLKTDDLSKPQGTLDDPIAALPGPPAGGLAGTWAAQYRQDCAGAPQDGEACVAGGAYWMGDPSFYQPSERLVVVSPFFVDMTEVSVAAYRAAGFAALVHVDNGTQQRFCTFTSAPGPFEKHPVTCAPPPEMKSYCEKKGGALLSEAQWEYLGSARRSAPYVWGSDAARCEYAVYARFAISGNNPALSACKALGEGPQPIGSGTLDRLDLPGGSVVDLMGNVAEFVRDAWDDEGGPCWNAPLLYDPLCAKTQPPGPPFRHTLRGSNFAETLGRASDRAFDPSPSELSVSSQVGFRCARPAR